MSPVRVTASLDVALRETIVGTEMSPLETDANTQHDTQSINWHSLSSDTAINHGQEKVCQAAIEPRHLRPGRMLSGEISSDFDINIGIHDGEPPDPEAQISLAQECCRRSSSGVYNATTQNMHVYRDV